MKTKQKNPSSEQRKTARKMQALVMVTLLALVFAPATAAHSVTGSHKTSDMLMTDLTASFSDVAGDCSQHSQTGSTVWANWRGEDGPSYRITRSDDYTADSDKRWKTLVRYDINNGASNVKEIDLITDYWTDDVESGTHSASAVDGTGCGWYYNKIEGETWEQTCCNSDGTWADCCSSIIAIDGGSVQVRITQT